MSGFTIDGVLLRDMFLTGAKVLEKNKNSINALNVFPVPDGDTGTNMSMTMQSAAKSLKESPCDNAETVAGAAALGALKGARGNSGVILSQILRGFSRAMKDVDTVDAKTFALAFSMGSDSAYKAVMRPKEGTILTVIRVIAESLRKAARAGKDIPELIDIMLASGEDALKKTPDLLPVLKSAGVVDAGGMGLLAVLRGFKMALDGEEADDLIIGTDDSTEGVSGSEEYSDNADIIELPDTSDIKFPYCTEFFIINLYAKPTDEDVDKLREKLVRIGDSVVVAFDDSFIKVHVHSSSPGKVLQLALRLGELDKVKIENMLEQNRAMHENMKKTEKEYAIISVCAGDGIEQLFRDLGASAIISGGQTMNPSIESITKTIKRVNAKNVYILPNNSNIILAAQQAAALMPDKKIVVLPTKTIMQGISAITAFNADLDTVANTQRMTSALEHVISGSVTFAVRSTVFDGIQINEGDILGLLNNRIVTTGNDVNDVASKLLDMMILMQPDDPVVTILYGNEQSEESANSLVETLEERNDDVDCIVQNGGQPLYYYFMSVE